MKNNLTIPKALAKLVLIDIISKKANKNYNLADLLEDLDWYIEQPKYETSHVKLVKAALTGGISYINLLSDFNKMLRHLLDVKYTPSELHQLLWKNYYSIYRRDGEGVWFCQVDDLVQMATRIPTPVMEYICNEGNETTVPYDKWVYAEYGSAAYYKLIKIIGRKANKILTFQNGKLVKASKEYKIKTLSILK